jgi:hypothetical protein
MVLGKKLLMNSSTMLKEVAVKEVRLGFFAKKSFKD